MVNQNPLILYERLGGVAVANHDRVVEHVDFQLRTRRQVKLVTDRFGNDDPPRTVDGGFHTSMVCAVRLESNEMPPGARWFKGMSRR